MFGIFAWKITWSIVAANAKVVKHSLGPASQMRLFIVSLYYSDMLYPYFNETSYIEDFNFGVTIVTDWENNKKIIS